MLRQGVGGCGGCGGAWDVSRAVSPICSSRLNCIRREGAPYGYMYSTCTPYVLVLYVWHAGNWQGLLGISYVRYGVPLKCFDMAVNPIIMR
jgi:hypothetical protein